MANEKKETELTPRELRRKRRIRNQILAYLTVGLLLCIVIVGCTLGVKMVVKTVQERKEIQEMAAQLEEMSTVEEPEAVVQETPPVEEIAEYTEEDLLEEIVDYCIAEMPLEERVAGLFMITPEALTGVDVATIAGSGTEEALIKYPVGGLVYFSQNMTSDEQFKDMLSTTTTMSKYPLFLAVDEEGGDVTRFATAGMDVPGIVSMGEIGAEGDTSKAYAAANTIGNYLGAYGINLNFAPVADVAGSDTSVIGTRSFGSDATQVSQMVDAAIRGTEDAGISTCIKHFPGMGSVVELAQEGVTVSELTKEQLQEVDLLPFQAGVQADVDMIMVSHIAFPAITGDEVPSSLSAGIVTDLLRNELGYTGVVITDALDDKTVSEQYTSAEAAVMALQAGIDMILMPENFEEAYEGVLAAVADGTLTEERITESLERIYRVKYRGVLEE